MAFEELTILVSNAENPLRIVLHEKEIGLSDIIITDGIDALCLITKLDLQTAPVNNSQEVLRKVPGLFIGQHAGGGKAEQIFLRGFDIDHGTDISINVDGTDLQQITFDDTFDAFPMFSYDGKKIVFASNRFNGDTRDTNIFIADWVD